MTILGVAVLFSNTVYNPERVTDYITMASRANWRFCVDKTMPYLHFNLRSLIDYSTIRYR